MAERRQERRGTAAAWAAANPVLASGEWGYQTDGDKVVKIGDGVTAWADLEPALSATYARLNEDRDALLIGSGEDEEEVPLGGGTFDSGPVEISLAGGDAQVLAQRVGSTVFARFLADTAEEVLTLPVGWRPSVLVKATAVLNGVPTTMTINTTGEFGVGQAMSVLDAYLVWHTDDAEPTP